MLRHQKAVHEKRQMWNCAEPGCRRVFRTQGKMKAHQKTEHLDGDREFLFRSPMLGSDSDSDDALYSPHVAEDVPARPRVVKSVPTRSRDFEIAPARRPVPAIVPARHSVAEKVPARSQDSEIPPARRPLPAIVPIRHLVAESVPPRSRHFEITPARRPVAAIVSTHPPVTESVPTSPQVAEIGPRRRSIAEIASACTEALMSVEDMRRVFAAVNAVRRRRGKVKVVDISSWLSIERETSGRDLAILTKTQIEAGLLEMIAMRKISDSDILR